MAVKLSVASSASLPLARVGQLSDAELELARQRWMEGYRDKWQHAGRWTGEEFDWIVWSTVWGFSVTNEAEAERASAAMPSTSPGTVVSGRWWAMDLNIGRVLALTGDSERATVHLARAAAFCERLREPHVHPLANALLGRARADSGHHDEAIEAFERVIASWGDAPRSTSAAMARRELQALRGRGKP